MVIYFLQCYQWCRYRYLFVAVNRNDSTVSKNAIHIFIAYLQV